MPDIFISYCNEDFETAKLIATSLEKNGWSVWWDREIPAGFKYKDIIKKELDAAKVVIVLWSEVSVNSDWVLDEAGNGKERASLLPILIENVDKPYGFGQTQTANLIGWDGDFNDANYLKLLRDINLLLGKPQPKINLNSNYKKQYSSNTKKSSANKFILIGAGVVIVALLFILAGTNKKVSPDPVSDPVQNTVQQQQTEPANSNVSDQKNQTTQPANNVPVSNDQQKTDFTTVSKELDKQNQNNSTATITVAYGGDENGCNLPLAIKIGNVTFTPLGRSYIVTGVPLGNQEYSIAGLITCPLLGNCYATGNGTVNVVNKGVYYVLWSISAVGVCSVELQSE